MSEPNASAIPTSRAASRSRTHKLTVTAMLSAVAFLLMFIEFPIPALIPAFVKLDVSDLPELLAAFSLGPVYGVAVALLKNLLFLVLHGTSSAYVGEVFNFIYGRRVRLLRRLCLSAATSPGRALLLGAVIGRRADVRAVRAPELLCGVSRLCGVLQAAAGGHRRDVSGHPCPLPTACWKCLVTFNMPFTFFKGMMDVALCFLVYKPLSPLLHK